MTATDTHTTTVVVAGPHLMAGLLGPRDVYLRQIERQFPNTTVVVRGNEIAARGPDGERVGRGAVRIDLVLVRLAVVLIDKDGR